MLPSRQSASSPSTYLYVHIYGMHMTAYLAPCIMPMGWR